MAASSVVGYLIPIILIAGIIYGIVMRIKHSEYALMPEKEQVGLPSFGFGFAAGLLLAILYVVSASESGQFDKVNWFLVTAIVIMAGGGLSLLIQVVSAFPAMLVKNFSRK